MHLFAAGAYLHCNDGNRALEMESRVPGVCLRSGLAGLQPGDARTGATHSRSGTGTGNAAAQHFPSDRRLARCITLAGRPFRRAFLNGPGLKLSISCEVVPTRRQEKQQRLQRHRANLDCAAHTMRSIKSFEGRSCASRPRHCPSSLAPHRADAACQHTLQIPQKLKERGDGSGSSSGNPPPKVAASAAAASVKADCAHPLPATRRMPSAQHAWDAINRQLVNGATAALLADVALRAAGGAADPDVCLVRGQPLAHRMHCN